MIGGLPTQKTALHPTITGRIAGNGFHIEKLVYQSLPGLYVTALVYVPDNGDKVHPAILVAAGHSQNGKIHYAGPLPATRAARLSRHQLGPRRPGRAQPVLGRESKKSRYNLICAEHAVMGNLAYLAGANLARWEIWDGIRAVDYLLTRPDVDPNRINLTGTSGGGFQTALLGALDERIKVIIPSCYITALPMRIENRIFVDPDSDPEQDLAGFISKGVDHAGLLLMMYPRAVMVADCHPRLLPYPGRAQILRRSQQLLSALRPRRPHRLRRKLQRAPILAQKSGSRTQLPRPLQPHACSPRTPSRHRFPEAELRVTRSGQISVDYPDAQPLLHFIAAYADEARTQPHKTLAQLYAFAGPRHRLVDRQLPTTATLPRRRCSGNPPAPAPSAPSTSTATCSTTAPICKCRCSTFTTMQHPAKGRVLWFSLKATQPKRTGHKSPRSFDEGYEVYSFDFRGLGETRMNYRAISEDDPGLVQGDFDQAYMSPLSSVLAGYVYNSLLTGRPYFLQMMDDLNIAARFIRSRQPGPHHPLTLAGIGEAFNLAAAIQQIDPTFRTLPAEEVPAIDWRQLVAQSKEDWPIALLLPSGALLR